MGSFSALAVRRVQQTVQVLEKKLLKISLIAKSAGATNKKPV